MAATAKARAREILQDRISELEVEKTELEEAVRALNGNSGSRKPGGKPKRSKVKSTRSRPASKSGPGKRISRSEREAQLLAHVKKSPKATNVELARTLGVTPAYVSMLIKRMSQGGQIKRENGTLVLKT